MDCPTPEELKLMREAMVRTKEQMGDMFGVSGQTWANWENGVRPLKVFRGRLNNLKIFLLGKK